MSLYFHDEKETRLYFLSEGAEGGRFDSHYWLNAEDALSVCDK